ncbi:MAG: tRNA pseudouridine(55) synthase TruB [Burkholderiales bacterium]
MDQAVRDARPPKRPVDGVLLLDKDHGISSHTALQRAKRLFCAVKAGHTGTLDPLAEGLLPVCFGEATKFSRFSLHADKAYRAEITLGVTTTSGDAEGDIVATHPVNVDRTALDNVLRGFVGETDQLPPMYSALKHQGRPLYSYARAGQTVSRAPRRVTIASLEMEAFNGTTLRINMACSAGTYVRVLATDIGAALGCGAHLSALRRTRVDSFDASHAHSYDALERMSMFERDAVLLAVDSLVQGLEPIELDATQTLRLQQGRPISVADTRQAALLRVYDAQQRFIGVAELQDGVLQALRMMTPVG